MHNKVVLNYYVSWHHCTASYACADIINNINRPAIRPLHLQYIMRGGVNVSRLSPLELQTVAADDDTLQAWRLRRQRLCDDLQWRTESTVTNSIHCLHTYPAHSNSIIIWRRFLLLQDSYSTSENCCCRYKYY